MTNASRFLSLLLLSSADVARADSWAAPTVSEVFSASRDHFVRISPGKHQSDTVDCGKSSQGSCAVAEFYARQPDRSYRLMHRAHLLNPVAPVRFFVSDKGQLATVDNWHNAGFGQVVAIYNPQGKLLRAYALDELFPPETVKAMPHSVSSIHWRGQAAYIRGDQRTLYVHAANEGGFLFGLESGRFTYCENYQGRQRCRNGSAQNSWHSGDATIDK